MTTIESVCTRVEYLYRDAGNWKQRGEFWLEGRLAFDDVEPFLFENLWFVPQAIGVESLTPDVRNDDDHCLHELVSLTADSVGGPAMNADQFLTRLRAAKKIGWFNQLTW